MPPRKLAGRDRALVWFAFLGGAAAWSVQLVAGYGVEELLCADSAASRRDVVEPVVVAVTALTGAAALGSLLAAAAVRRRAREGVLDDPRGRLAFMGAWGVLAGLLFATMIVLGGIQVLALDACTPG